ncbi:PACE efflux transporter [Allorhizobium terrae]|uniref:PACE efflux transporter n=1 Tax=Allorhizobium terrae TaxID=1848972 RepID=A0A4S4A725_9HYPH|nr:PACE efflux transporter [Allorhizobium terrae]THF53796.1 PACE efflux transporter [Allorhizobium terrae]
MKTVRDRVQHAIVFEVIALLIIIPLGILFFHMPANDIGLITIGSAVVATGWNYIYNLLFDIGMKRVKGDLNKTIPIRVFHAILFEAGLLAILAPLVALYLGITLVEALILDVSLSLFYVVYAFLFNLIYDRLFPFSQSRQNG